MTTEALTPAAAEPGDHVGRGRGDAELRLGSGPGPLSVRRANVKVDGNDGELRFRSRRCRARVSRGRRCCTALSKSRRGPRWREEPGFDTVSGYPRTSIAPGFVGENSHGQKRTLGDRNGWQYSRMSNEGQRPVGMPAGLVLPTRWGLARRPSPDGSAGCAQPTLQESAPFYGADIDEQNIRESREIMAGAWTVATDGASVGCAGGRQGGGHPGARREPCVRRLLESR